MSAAPTAWLRPPRLRTQAEATEELRATWIELFFELVFVAAIAPLAYRLDAEPSAAGFLQFAGLFIAICVWEPPPAADGAGPPPDRALLGPSTRA